MSHVEVELAVATIEVLIEETVSVISAKFKHSHYFLREVFK